MWLSACGKVNFTFLHWKLRSLETECWGDSGTQQNDNDCTQKNYVSYFLLNILIEPKEKKG